MTFEQLIFKKFSLESATKIIEVLKQEQALDFVEDILSESEELDELL
jgi:hypothetical protein